MKNVLQFVCIAIAAELVTAPDAFAESKPGPIPEIKLEWTDGLMLLTVEINDKPRSLIVDSGAMKTSMRESAAKELNVNLKDDATGKAVGIAGAFGGMKTGEIIIKVPGQKPDAFPKLSGAHPFIPLAAAEGKPDVVGAIGLDDLFAAGAVLDCVDGILSLDSTNAFRAPKDFLEISMTRLATDLNGNGNEKGDFFWSVPVSIHGKQGLMVVDTGASTTVLDKNFATTAGVDLEQSKHTAAGAGGGAQELTTGMATNVVLGGKVELGSIRVNGCDLKNIREQFKPASGDTRPFAGILGMDQLPRVRAVLDFKRGIFCCSKTALNVDLNPAMISQALEALAQKDDRQASKLRENAAKNGGRLEIDSLQAGQLIIRARTHGLLDDKPAASSTADDLVTALTELSKAGDEDAKRLLAQAAANNGHLEITPQEADKIVARARKKGLLDKKKN